jgi:hypothetical protein
MKKTFLSKQDIKSSILNWDFLPEKALEEIITWKNVHKSPCSYSFYSNTKEWNHTEEGTIRISDHWNFIAERHAKRTGDCRIHAVTDIPVLPHGNWYKGVYSDSKKCFNIIEYYGEKKKLTKDIIRKLKDSIVIEEKDRARKFNEEEITIRREFSNQIDLGNVFVKYNEEWLLVKQMTRSNIDYVLNGKTIRVKTDNSQSWSKRIGFSLIVNYNGVIIEGMSELRKIVNF